jgi:hypothetical protein
MDQRHRRNSGVCFLVFREDRPELREGSIEIGFNRFFVDGRLKLSHRAWLLWGVAVRIHPRIVFVLKLSDGAWLL